MSPPLAGSNFQFFLRADGFKKGSVLQELNAEGEPKVALILAKHYGRISTTFELKISLQNRLVKGTMRLNLKLRCKKWK